MADFNPYQTWLQVKISPGETPTYYKLLGLAEFEDNSQTISKAAEKQLSRLLAIKPEKHRPQWQKLINELAEAQSTLTHPQHKTNYDNRLKGITTSETAAPEASNNSAVKTETAIVTEAPAVPNAATPVMAAPVYAQPVTPGQPIPGGTPILAAPVAAPFGAQPYQGQPITAQPYQAQPYQAQPYQAQPYQAQPVQAQPVQAQPVYAAPVPPTFAPPVAGGYPGYGQASPPTEQYRDPMQPFAAPAPQFPQPGYGQPMAAQPVYGQAPYAAPSYGQAPYGQVPAQPFAAPYTPAAPSASPFAAPAYNPPASPFGQPAPTSSYEATAAHDPFTSMKGPSSLPGMDSAPLGHHAPAAPGAGLYSAALAPMNGASPLAAPLGSSTMYAEPAAPSDGFGGSSVAARYRPARKESPLLYIVLAGFAVLAIVGGLAAYSMLGNKNSDQVAKTEHPPEPKKPKSPEVQVPVSVPAVKPEHTKPEPTKPEPIKPEPPKPVEPPKNPQPEMTNPEMPQPEVKKPEPKKPEPKPEVKKPEPKPEPKPMPAPTSAKATPEEHQVIVTKLAEVRKLVSERKFSDAKRLLKEVGELAKTPDVQDLHEGMELVVNYNEQFWQAVKSSMRTASGEISIGSTPANIVASDANEITIRTPGKNNSYTYENVPPGLAIALADRWFDKNPANLAAKASYQFARKNGNLEEARTMLNAAQGGGVDTKFILKLLDEPGVLGK